MGGGCQPHHTPHCPIKHIYRVWPGKKSAGWLCGFICACMALCSFVCVLSEGWDSVLMMKDSRAIE